jgi:hypothetical protein
MSRLRFLPPSQRNELTKLRVLEVLSDPAIAKDGLSAGRIFREVEGVGCEATHRKLLKEMETEGLVEHRVCAAPRKLVQR